MDNQNANIQDSCDISISSEEEDGFERHKEGNVEQPEHGKAPVDALQDPDLGMTFDCEDDVREYYKTYAKSKGFGVTRRSSHTVACCLPMRLREGVG
jgi:hypothetical protein